MSNITNLEIGYFDPFNFTHNEKDLLTGVPYKVDDFEDHFASARIKIICFMLFFLCETFSNVYYILFIMFEKYGGDPLKRSVTNQVYSKDIKRKARHQKLDL